MKTIKLHRRERDQDIEEHVEGVVRQLLNGVSLAAAFEELNYLHPNKMTRVHKRVIHWIRTEGMKEGLYEPALDTPPPLPIRRGKKQA